MANLTAKAIHFSLEVPLYTQAAVIILGYSTERAANIIAEYGGCEETVKEIRTLDQCQGVTIRSDKDKFFTVYLPELPRTCEQHAVLVHELFHLTEQIMKRIGMTLDSSTSSEAYAYLIDWLTAATLGRLWTATNI